MAPVFEMFNHAEDNNAFFDFDKINKKLYVAAIKERVIRTSFDRPTWNFQVKQQKIQKIGIQWFECIMSAESLMKGY